MTYRMLPILIALTLAAAGCPESPGGGSADADTDEGEPPRPDLWEPDVVDVYGPYGSGGSGSGGTADDAGQPDTSADTDSGPPCNRITFTYPGDSAASVWVTGSFTDWAATPEDGALELTESDGTWSLTTTLPDRGRHYYKFIVDGNEWVPDPTNGKQTTDYLGGRRSIVDVCRTEPTPDCGVVNFHHTDPDASSVELAGDFTDWDQNAIAMTEINGVWRTTQQLEPGEHQYKFIVDGTWITDPENPETVEDGQGGMNSLLDVACGE